MLPAAEGNPLRSPEQPATEPAISLRGITKTFGSHQALRGVDLDLYPGECLGLVGDNAAGKSTLTKIISGTYIPDGGTIKVAGETVELTGPADARNRNIEMVFQDLSLCDHIDVVGNLFLGRELSSGLFLDRKKMTAEAERMLEALEIRIPRLSAKVEKLSGGQRQAIAIARAASFQPKVLIMDRTDFGAGRGGGGSRAAPDQPGQGQGRFRGSDHPSSSGSLPRLRPHCCHV
nr:ATP-binding cassette domain-containing protein [Marinicella sp. W31]MDC2875627.1 ATP-binding cassette domain-containing protein [Marinicella sp. W31]